MRREQNKKLRIFGIIKLFLTKHKKNDIMVEKQHKINYNRNKWYQSNEVKEITDGDVEIKKYEDCIKINKELFIIEIETVGTDREYIGDHWRRFEGSEK